ncbi:hypothetical protein B0T17DRAFT_540359 [Bombardia bombarda]|uniref:SnoaL-like domain-containing protein n=1 Tax=Bombardia bombarda TaxID=252184 RepID=A0AA39WG99_9PEZI|nr:hypothetical protein B0T17DRAFT_540359 [Bombardia bombarda]
MASAPLTLPAKLNPPLTGRDAIVDAVHRCLAGLDAADQGLWESGWHPEGTMEINGNVMRGRKELHDKCFATISKLDTTHFMTNVRVTLTDDAGTKAAMTATVLAQHYREGKGLAPGEPRILAGNLYGLNLEKDPADDLWKIKDWVLKSTWGEGDWQILMGN